MEIFVFTILSLLAVIFAVLMVANKNPLASALSLVVTFSCLGGLFFLLAAPIIGILQILIYSGAIMILFVLVIMLVGQENIVEQNRLIFQKYFAVLIGSALLVQLLIIFSTQKKITLNESNAPYLSISYPQNFAKVLFYNYSFPFELTSIILLLGILGVMVIAKKRNI